MMDVPFEIGLYYNPIEENEGDDEIYLRIFGEIFVENNKDNCKIIYKGQEYEIEEFFKNIDGNYNNKDLFNINLKINKNITDMSYMFDGCESLISLPDLSKWNTSNVVNMSGVFSGCKSLSSLPDISEWNTFNVTNMSSMFCGCNSLASLPNISKWNTSNVTSMSGIFFNCNSLSSLPNISNWNVSYCPYMNHMFDYI